MVDVLSLCGYTIAFVVVALAFAYKKLRDMRSNIPALDLFFLKQSNMRGPEDVKAFAEGNKAGLVHGMVGLNSYVFITHPDTAQIMLKDEENFVKDPTGLDVMAPLMGHSLALANGEKWKIQKDIFSPAFHFEYIKQMVPVFISKSKDLLDLWSESGGKAVEIKSHMSHFTLDTLALTTFGLDFNSIRGGHHDYLASYSTLTQFLRPGKKEVDHAVSELYRMTYEIIESKSGKSVNGDATPDLLDRLLLGKSKLTKEQMRDNVFLMFIAGHETTSYALTWALYFLAKYPEMQKRAKEEVDAVLKGETPDAESVKNLIYLDMFIKEGLRHRPPVANLLTRKTAKETQVKEYLVPKSSYVGLSIYTVHHLKEFWENPDTFDPLRFTQERSAGRHPFAYIPFSLGRRNCIGSNFSLLEQKIFLSMVLQRYNISINPKCVDSMLPTFQVCWPINVMLDFTSHDKN